ncbi:MAG: PaaI family thioesterase [Terracidiphilus sp.]
MIPHYKDALTPFAHSASNRCFGCGPANPGGLQLAFLVAPDGTLVCLTTIPDRFEGHPGYLHGGIIATLLDEAMSKAVRSKGLTAMTRQMETDYLRPVPSTTAIRLEGRVTRSEGRKHWAEAHIFDAGHKILAQSKALFVEIKAR